MSFDTRVAVRPDLYPTASPGTSDVQPPTPISPLFLEIVSILVVLWSETSDWSLILLFVTLNTSINLCSTAP